MVGHTQDNAIDAPGPPQIPHVVWRCIVSHLGDSLATLLDLASMSRDLQDICRPHISAFFQSIRYKPIAPLSPFFFYHDILRHIWKGDIDPELMYEFYGVYQHQRPSTFASSATSRPGLPEHATEADVRKFDRSLKHAIEQSAFIQAEMRPEVCRRFQHGDHDAALLLLLPMLTRLKTLEIPARSPLCAAYFETLSKEYARRDIDASIARQTAYDLALRDRDLPPTRKRARENRESTLPFSELLILYSSAPDHGCGLNLSDMTPFMAIPSLHRIVLVGVCRDFASWNTHSPPTCPEIYFQQSACSAAVARTFAAALKGPCDIKQWYQHHDDPHGFTDVHSIGWDHITITPNSACTDERSDTGETTIKMSIGYEGGNPGYEHAWVSWLFHEKMLDWRRLDQVFELGEGDEDCEWLQGMLCW